MEYGYRKGAQNDKPMEYGVELFQKKTKKGEDKIITNKQRIMGFHDVSDNHSWRGYQKCLPDLIKGKVQALGTPEIGHASKSKSSPGDSKVFSF